MFPPQRKVELRDKGHSFHQFAILLHWENFAHA